MLRGVSRQENWISVYALNYYNYIDQIIKLKFILMFVLNEYYKSIESSKLDNVKYIQLLF